MRRETEGQKTFNPVGVVVKTIEGSIIRGQVNIGLHDRLSDFLNDAESARFLVVFEAVYHAKPNQVYFVNRDHVVYVQPDPVKEKEGGKETSKRTGSAEGGTHVQDLF